MASGFSISKCLPASRHCRADFKVQIARQNNIDHIDVLATQEFAIVGIGGDRWISRLGRHPAFRRLSRHGDQLRARSPNDCLSVMTPPGSVADQAKTTVVICFPTCWIAPTLGHFRTSVR